MSRWRRILKEGLLENGLINEVKAGLQELEQHNDVVRRGTDTARQWWRDAELGPPPDRCSDPQGALEYELNLVVSCLLQRPHQESYYLVRSIGQALGQQVLSHPMLRGLGPLLNVLGRNGPKSQLTGLLGVNWFGQAVFRGGESLVAGQQAHTEALAVARHYDSLMPAEQAMVDQALVLLALLEESPTHPELGDGVALLQRLLDQDGDALADTLVEPHRGQWHGLLARRLPQWPPQPA